MEPTSLVLGVEEVALQEEVLHFLDRSPRLHVVGLAEDGAGLSRVVRERRPDAAVASPSVVATAPGLDGAPLLVVAARETTEALRAALGAGARGFYLWPEEREALALEAERSRRASPVSESAPGRVIAVLGARGGAGATFLATNLAAALAGSGATTALADLDLFFADLTPALGVDGHEPTLADLAPLASEVTAEQLDRVLYDHPRGFRVLPAPGDPQQAATIGPRQVTAAVGALSLRHEVVVVHVPRQLGPPALAALESADVILVVLSLDVLAFRDARRLLGFLEANRLRSRCRLVVNRAVRSEVAPADAEDVFGMRPVCVLGVHRGATRAQNRGEVVAGGRSRVSRRIAALAGQLMDEAL
jgi:pilus assembly protein CpaE